MKGILKSGFHFKGCQIERNLHRIPTDKENQLQNDMIREFALQVHHQQYFISAKGYFQIDLKLISSVSIFYYPIKIK